MYSNKILNEYTSDRHPLRYTNELMVCMSKFYLIRCKNYKVVCLRNQMAVWLNLRGNSKMVIFNKYMEMNKTSHNSPFYCLQMSFGMIRVIIIISVHKFMLTNIVSSLRGPRASHSLTGTKIIWHNMVWSILTFQIIVSQV